MPASNHAQAPESDDGGEARKFSGGTCPTCGGAITGFSTRSPTEHVAQPCGHEIGGVTVADLLEGPDDELLRVATIEHADDGGLQIGPVRRRERPDDA